MGRPAFPRRSSRSPVAARDDARRDACLHGPRRSAPAMSEAHRNGEAAGTPGVPTPDTMGHAADMPASWAGILSPAQWELATGAIGRARVEELRGMLLELGPPFRAAFVRHLARLAPDHPAGAAVMLAIAQAAHDTRSGEQA